MKTLSKNEKVVRWYYSIWAGYGYNATDISYFSAERAIRDAVKFAFEYKETVWVELKGINVAQDVVKVETIFRFDYSKVVSADKKVSSTIDFKYPFEKK